MRKLLVRSVLPVAERILSFELVDASGSALPAFSAGAHIDVAIPGCGVRQYSLCNEPHELDVYRIAVLEAPQGRGGSQYLHRNVHAGDLLECSEPRNLFPLADTAEHSILIAGGIGITPIIAMAETLARKGAPFDLYYCTESASRAAFIDRLCSAVQHGQLIIHHDGGCADRRMDIAPTLASRAPGTHLYYCGPPGLMETVRNASLHWPRDAVHCEYFATKPASTPATSGFSVFLQRSKLMVKVQSDQTLLSALRDAGVDCDSSCEAGLCGTCRIQYLRGRVEHNDLVLTEQERETSLLACCARALDDSIVLDL